MLILCSGPDSYRAIHKARDLEQAFKDKFDKTGTSVEHLDARDGIEELAKRIDTISLFSPKRFIRFDGLISLAQKKGKDQLNKILSKSVDDAIVVTVEEEAPEARQLEVLKAIPKFVHYPFPSLNVAQFDTWVETKARELGINDSAQSKQIASACFPDAWLALNELVKVAAGSTDILTKQTEKNPYSWAEDVLFDEKAKADFLLNATDEDSALPSLLNAARVANKIMANQTQGLHPFVVQKLRAKLNHATAETDLANLSSALLLQRAGFGTDEELLASI